MCGKILVWLPMKGMISLILLLVRHVFRGDEFLAVFSDRRGIGTEKMQEGHGLGWSAGRVRVRSVWGGNGQDFSNSSGAGLNFANAGWKQTKNFNPGRTLVETWQHWKIKRWPVMLKVCQPHKNLSCEYFPAEIPTKLNWYFYHYNFRTFYIHYFV